MGHLLLHSICRCLAGPLPGPPPHPLGPSFTSPLPLVDGGLPARPAPGHGVQPSSPGHLATRNRVVSQKRFLQRRIIIRQGCTALPLSKGSVQPCTPRGRLEAHTASGGAVRTPGAARPAQAPGAGAEPLLCWALLRTNSVWVICERSLSDIPKEGAGCL